MSRNRQNPGTVQPKKSDYDDLTFRNWGDQRFAFLTRLVTTIAEHPYWTVGLANLGIIGIAIWKIQNPGALIALSLITTSFAWYVLHFGRRNANT